MVKTLGVVAVAAALVLGGGWNWVRSTVLVNETPQKFLDRAATQLEKRHAETGTYSGEGAPGVTLIWADESRYCIEFGSWFLLGPGGTPSEQSCRR